MMTSSTPYVHNDEFCFSGNMLSRNCFKNNIHYLHTNTCKRVIIIYDVRANSLVCRTNIHHGVKMMRTVSAIGVNDGSQTRCTYKVPYCIGFEKSSKPHSIDSLTSAPVHTRLGTDIHADIFCIGSSGRILRTHAGKTCQVRPFDDGYEPLMDVEVI